MASHKLTQSFVDRVKPSARDTFYWHTARVQRGARLGLKVTPAGKKVFVVQYRPLGGRRDTARRLALAATDLRGAEREARRLFAQDLDPARARREERLAETVQEAIPQFLRELEGKQKPRTIYETTRILGGDVADVTHEGYVRDVLGAVRVQDVTPTMVAALHRRIWNGDDEKRPVMANRVLAALSGFFTWCERRGLRPRGSNPARGVPRYRETPRERFLTGEELARLSAALRLAETDGLLPAARLRKSTPNATQRKHRPRSADTPRRADPTAVAAIRFLIFSGMREQEALSLRWDALDLSRALVTLADSKTGRSTRPLGAPALRVLAALPRDGAYVFPGAVDGQPRKEIKRTWYAVREAAQLDGLRLHDLRHTVASVAASGGATLPMVAALLGHKDLKSTQRYAHLFDEAKQQAADRTAGDIEAAMQGRATPVVALRPKASVGGDHA